MNDTCNTAEPAGEEGVHWDGKWQRNRVRRRPPCCALTYAVEYLGMLLRCYGRLQLKQQKQQLRQPWQALSSFTAVVAKLQGHQDSCRRPLFDIFKTVSPVEMRPHSRSTSLHTETFSPLLRAGDCTNSDGCTWRQPRVERHLTALDLFTEKPQRARTSTTWFSSKSRPSASPPLIASNRNRAVCLEIVHLSLYGRISAKL